MLFSLRVLLLALASMAIEKDIAAAEWTLNGSLDQQAQYNDNFAFTTNQKESVIGYLLTPTLQAALKTKMLDIAFEGQGDIRRYDKSRWDCDNYNLNSTNTYRTGRNVFSLSGRYASTCSYTQQITDTGLIVPNIQSENYQITPRWAWEWTTRDQLMLDTSYSKTSFSNTSGGEVSTTDNNVQVFTGNETYTINVGENHQWSRRLSLNGKLFFSNIQYTGSDAFEQNLFGFQLGAKYKINRLWTISAGGGPVWVDETQQGSDNVASEQSSSLSLGNVANINIEYKYRLTQFSTGFTNSVSPSAIGQTLQNNAAFVNYSYQLTQHLLFDLSGNFSLNQSIGDNSAENSTSQFDRTFFTVSTGIAWEFTKDWQLRGSYTYSRQDLKQDGNTQNLIVGTSDANKVMLFLTYSWNGIRISR